MREMIGRDRVGFGMEFIVLMMSCGFCFWKFISMAFFWWGFALGFGMLIFICACFLVFLFAVRRLGLRFWGDFHRGSYKIFVRRCGFDFLVELCWVSLGIYFYSFFMFLLLQ